MKNLIIALSVLALVACRSTSPASQASEPSASAPSWNESMRSLKKSLTTIQPLIFDSANFADVQNQEILGKEIHKMALESASVRHDPTLIARDPTVRFVSSQFAEDLQRADASFAEGKKSFARYQLVKVTSYCVECHARTQQGPAFYFGTLEPSFSKMSAADRIEYLIASRHFDKALDLAVKTLRSAQPNSPPAWQMDKVAHLGLQVAVQYKQDPSSAANVVAAVEKNPNLPLFLKAKTKSWRDSLATWKPESSLVITLPEARKLIENRKSEVDAMRAVTGLLAILSKDLTPSELGEALLLTGQSYEALNDISPLSLHENYYESCIRRVPHTQWAKQCYERLAKSTVLGYSGSSGTHIPVEVQIHLQKLKKEAE